ncbi:uncharacterized protein N7473_001998 [Penicillium subrubescens]|uniref:uncharacterized protein n=1 Tax=Penicillium subrubescens TaxID=1316194 RepID=UPI002545B185|nr:uncharacterized protein N7473_001998 [Penicillium subrubescens]KAJ5905082.1 hypothetical protein N7473_001998 [Penicillium subrubescens]
MPPEPILTQLWRRESICKRLNHDLSTNDLISCRLVCRDLAAQSAPDLFTDITIRFRCRSLSRPSRVSALERIGHHIRQVTFIIAHTAETFLPPVIDAGTGKEQTFVYTPQHQQGPPRSPKYGTWEMTDLLLKQYPPLFHAATDVPSFVRVLSLMKNLRHLRITCEGQPPSHRYRRSVVDYTLISLRIAAEQPNLGFGASPASRKRWSQIRHLTIHMESFPYQAGSPTDHFKLLHAYLQSFPGLRTIVFHWKGARGLSPLSLASEPCLQNAANKRSRQADGRHGSQFLRPLRLPYLQEIEPYLQEIELVNVVMDASQVASFVFDHRKTLHELNFQDTVLRTGTWDEVLAPLTRKSGSTRWKQHAKHERSADVPIMLKPVAISQQSVPRGIRPVQPQHEGLMSSAREVHEIRGADPII